MVDGLGDAVVDGREHVLGAAGEGIPPGLDGVVDGVVGSVVVVGSILAVVDEGDLLLLSGPVTGRDEAGGSGREQEDGRGPHGSSVRAAAQAGMVLVVLLSSIGGSTKNQANRLSKGMDHGETRQATRLIASEEQQGSN